MKISLLCFSSFYSALGVFGRGSRPYDIIFIFILILISIPIPILIPIPIFISL